MNFVLFVYFSKLKFNSSKHHKIDLFCFDDVMFNPENLVIDRIENILMSGSRAVIYLHTSHFYV